MVGNIQPKKEHGFYKKCFGFFDQLDWTVIADATFSKLFPEKRGYSPTLWETIIFCFQWSKCKYWKETTAI